MIFKRRFPQKLTDKIRNLIWPKMGIKRLVDYYKHRTIRIPASEHSIAAGIAFGCAISWTPPIGTHLIQCLLFSWITRTSWVAGFIGTAFGNPWTTPFMMVLSYLVGKALYIGFGYEHLLIEQALPFSFELLTKEGLKIFLPTMLGGYVLALATYPLFYYPAYYIIKGARAARRSRIQKVIHDVVDKITGAEADK